MKTPEELAEEYVHAWWGPREDNMTLATRQAFLAGYKTGHTAGFESAMKIHDCVAEYIAKKEGIHTEIITHEPLLKDYK